MTARLKVKVDREPRAFLRAFMAAEQPIARAATAAVGEAGERSRRRRVPTSPPPASAANGRTRSASTAIRAGEASINAAAHVYHRIHYAWVHEEGATIHGQPVLWLPLAHAPAKIGRFRMTPRRYPGPLQFVRRAGPPPLLVAKLGVSRAKAKAPGKISLAAAKKGAAGGGKTRVLRSVPMFVGISTVRLRKRFNITGVVRREAARLAELYAKHLEVDER